MFGIRVILTCSIVLVDARLGNPSWLTYEVLQTRYYFRPERAEVLSQKDEMFHLEMSVSKANRTTNGMNAVINVLQNITRETKLYVKVQVYAFFSNEYRPMPLIIKRKFCDMVDLELRQFIELEQQADSNLPARCPFLVGEYRIRNATTDAANFPAGIPWKKIMVNVLFLDKADRTIAHARLYAQLDTLRT